ncbi:hypothetical protein O0L34_g5081 [Tuta absoluta]|nr:hypothetical protein O0L34_g5081 [Tuta absoluta]
MGHGHSMTLGGSGDQDVHDELSGLSKLDVAHIRHTWTPMWEQAERVGCDILQRMLYSENSNKTLLKTFRHMDHEALQHCSQFKGHAIDFMSNINNLVNHLHEPTVAIAILHIIGGLQTKERVKYFDTLGKEFLDYLAEERKLTDSRMETWKRFVAFVNMHVMKHG